MSVHQYKQIKDKICLFYDGNSPEYLIQLRLLRPSLESKFPEISFTFVCKDQYLSYLQGDTNIMSMGDYTIHNPKPFAYTLPLIYDAGRAVHPIMWLLKESQISIQKYLVKKSISQTGYVCPEGNYPTGSLDARQVNHLRSWVQSRGFKPLVIGTSVNETRLPIDKRPSPQERMEMARTAGFVVGVECDMIYEAIGAGIPTALVPTGDGRELYEAICDKPIILGV